ncbi:unnamed protein product [Gadus morhua 'NCC']
MEAVDRGYGVKGPGVRSQRTRGMEAVDRGYGGSGPGVWRQWTRGMEAVDQGYGGSGPGVWRQWTRGTEAVDQGYGGCGPGVWRQWTRGMEAVDQGYGGSGPGVWRQWTRGMEAVDQGYGGSGPGVRRLWTRGMEAVDRVIRTRLESDCRRAEVWFNVFPVLSEQELSQHELTGKKSSTPPSESFTCSTRELTFNRTSVTKQHLPVNLRTPPDPQGPSLIQTPRGPPSSRPPDPPAVFAAAWVRVIDDGSIRQGGAAAGLMSPL